MGGTLAKACGTAAHVMQMVVLEPSPPSDLLQALLAPFSMCYSLPGNLGPGRLAVRRGTLKQTVVGLWERQSCITKWEQG